MATLFDGYFLLEELETKHSLEIATWEFDRDSEFLLLLLLGKKQTKTKIPIVGNPGNVFARNETI